MTLRIKILIILTLLILAGCQSEPQTPQEWEAQQSEGVQEGFEEFLKDKEQQDQIIAQETLEEAQIRPETFEAEKTKVEVDIPDELSTKYGLQLTNCFEGHGSLEKVAALASWCVTELAATNSDEQLCSRLLVGEGLDKCYQAVAKETKNIALCEKISSDVTKMSCIEVIS